MVRPIVEVAFGTISKKREKRLGWLEIREKIETIQTTARLKLAKIIRSWRSEETCCHSNSSEKPSANAYVKKTKTNKNSKGVK